MSAPNIIPSIFTAKDMYTIPVGKMGMATTRLGLISDTTMIRMERNFRRISTSAMEMAHGMLFIGAAIVAPLGIATHAAVEFEKQMGNVGTLVDTTKESIGLMGDDVLKMSKKIPKAMEDLTKSLYQIRSDGIAAGNGINEAFGVLESSGKLATAGISTVEEAAKTLTSGMNVFTEAGLNSAEMANSFFKTVQGGKTTMSELGQSFGKNAAIIHSAGVSLFEMNAATAAITATGITASQAQNELGASVLALMKPTGNLQTIFENLGYAGEGGFKKLIQATGGLVPALEKINATANKLGITMSEDFGRKEALVANILLTGERKASYMEQLAKQLDGTNTLEGKFAEQNAKAAQRMQLFKNSANRLGISLGNLLIPVLEKAMGIIEPVIDGIADFAKEHKTLSKIIITSLGAFGLFAVAVGTISFAVGTLTRSFILLETAGKAYNFLMGVMAVKTGTLNGVLMETPAYAKGATFAVKGLNVALARSLVTLIAIYGIWKLFDKKHEARDKMNAIMSHLPEGVDKKKFSDQFGDILSPGHIPLAKRMQGVKRYYPQSLYDSLEKKYYTDPMRVQDSIMNSPLLLPVDTTQPAQSYAPAPFYGGMRSEPGPANAGEDTEHKVVVEINNNSGHQVNASSSNSAVAVVVKTKSTFNRTKTGLS
jgi:TP901 family phage tail tape measure protein